ncbi:MAG: hypothetical protein ACIAXF_08775 [Phycisphaerales bacterium JB063]
MLSLPYTLAATWLDRALGLDDSMSFGAENTALGWDHPLPAWAWVLIVLLALALAGWSYHRLAGPRPLRIGLALLRSLLLVLIAVLLAGPTLVRTDTTPDPDWLLVMVDRSASLGFEDVALGGGVESGVISRDAALRRALARQAGVFGDDRLGANRHIVWLGFDRDAYPIDPPSAVDPDDAEALAELLPPAQQQATNLRSAVDQALQLAAGRAISGIVLLTDAQSPQPTGQPFIDKLAALQAPVYAVPLGSDEQRLDLTIDRVDLPATAFVGDLVPVSVTVRRLDLGPGVVDGGDLDPADIVVQLINADTGEVLDTQTLEGVGLGSPLRMQTRNDTEGELNLRVEVAYTPSDRTTPAPDDASDNGNGASTAGQEISLNNNTRLASVELIDRPIKVLYVEGTARWEYRYLVTMLKREASIDSSVLLLDSDRSFVQEGDSPITHFPQTAEELRPFDVIIIGDVRPRFFSEEQLALIRDHVAQRGAGLLWIGGPRYTPNFYAGSDLELLLPMTRPGSVSRLVPPQGNEVPIAPTPDARLLNLLQLSLGRDTDDAQTQPEWPDNLPGLRWAQDLGALRPGAKPLADAPGLVDAETGQPRPLVVLYRYGAGETLYVGTDETWRWRRVGGEVYFEQFWIQLIRKLGTARVQQQDDRANFTVGPPVVDLGAPQLVELVIDDPALMRIAPPTISVAIYHDAPADDADPSAPREAVGELDLRPVSAPPGAGTPTQSTYRAVWRSDRSGQFVLRVTEPLLEPIGLEATAEVRDPAEELAHAATDHDRLIRLANGTGGAVVGLNDLSRLESLVADLSREITHETRRPLTNTMLALGLILVLLTLEWVLRRVAKLV